VFEGAVKTGYTEVNGLNLYWEMRGSGHPLILLHGGLGSTDMVRSVAETLAQSRVVVSVDLQAHGRTADIDRPLSFESMADDLAALAKSLGFDKIDLMGYSLGAGVCLWTAIRHPELVRKLIVVSIAFQLNGWFPEVVAMIKNMSGAQTERMKPSRIYQTYAAVAPKPENFPTLLDKVAALIGQDYDWSNEIACIKAQTMLVFADADSVRPAHIIRFLELLGGGSKDGGWDGSGMSNARLALLPGLTHYNMITSPLLCSVVLPFLDAPMS